MKFKTILADPPWPERGGGVIKRGADRHYELMKIPDIIAYMRENIMADDNAHLYLWTTNNYLPDALSVMKLHGLDYKTNIAWVKSKDDGESLQIGLGQYFRGSHELCLFGVKGNLPYRTRSDGKRATIPTVIIAPRTEHSRKPDEIYRACEQVSHPPYLELFARRRREGWESRGNEVER
jgi:N6-adenosine-specific RNA methylase IME4